MPPKTSETKKVREMTYTQAIREAFDIALEKDPQVFLIGEGIPDLKGAFGTTTGLQEKYGRHRVMDMPLSENGLTGVCVGAALAGMRPVLTHMRIEFSMLSMDQILNNASMWHYMFGGQQSVPIVIRGIIGRGWGQGPQHSQSLQAIFAHIPGIKVVMPVTPSDAKGLLLAAIFDNNPVIFIEHRWLHNIQGPVPSGYYEIPIGKARMVKEGKDISVVATSHMVVESLQAAVLVKQTGVTVDLVDVRTIKPLDEQTICKSVEKTKRLLVVDAGWRTLGVAGDIVARVVEREFHVLKLAPRRITLPDIAAPTSKVLAEQYYPNVADIATAIMEMTGVARKKQERIVESYNALPHLPSDVPDNIFSGPF